MARALKALFSGTFSLLLVAALALPGCDTDDEVLDVDTPNGGVEVEEELDGGVDVDVHD